MEELKELKEQLIEEISIQLMKERNVPYLGILNSLLITVADLISKNTE